MPPNPSELLGSTAMQRLFDSLAEWADWIIVDAESGDIITGNSIAYGGSVTKNIQGSGSFYFLISNRNADSYRFTLETTRAEFGDVLIESDIVHLKDYLNAL